MNPIDYFVLGIIILIVGTIVTYMIISKKRGKGCAGCHSCGQCNGECQKCKSPNDK